MSILLLLNSISISDTKDALLNHALGISTFPKPDNIYIGLYTTAPAGPTPGIEVSGGSYSRQLATFTNSINGVSINNININFLSMPSCTIVALGIFNSSTPISNDLIFWKNLSSNKVIPLGESVQISIGALAVTLD